MSSPYLLLLAITTEAVTAQTYVHYTVYEETTPVALLGNIIRDAPNADPDWQANGIAYRCVFLSRQPFADHLHFRGCSVYIIRVIDREAVCPDLVTCELQFIVAISKLHDNAYFHKISLEVTILDINDNAPMFGYATTDLQISEAAPIGSMFTVPSARDRDGPDIHLSYHLHTHNLQLFPFRLHVDVLLDNSSHVQLVLNAPLDRETVHTYQLYLSASDNRLPSLSSVLMINVFVQDVNNNAPEIKVNFLSNQTGINSTTGLEYVCISENVQPGTVIAIIQASDRDVGVNGNLTVSMDSRPPGMLATEWSAASAGPQSLQEARLIVVGNLTAQSTLRVTVTGQDGGMPRRFTDHPFNIYVTDTCGQIKFEHFTSHVQVFENTANGSIITTFNISTVPLSDDSSLHVQIFPNYIAAAFRLQVLPICPGLFKVNVLANEIFDTESRDMFQCKIRAFDPEIPFSAGEKNLHVTITDLNDNAPVFERNSYNVTMSHQSSIGSAVVTVRAFDQDTTSSLYYHLQHVSGLTFVIDHNTGMVTLAAQLTIPYYHMVVSACDGVHCTQCPLDVHVIDMVPGIVG